MRERVLEDTSELSKHGIELGNHPASDVPTCKFRNDNLEEFNTNYYVLTELLNSRIHPFRKRFLSNIFPKILG